MTVATMGCRTRPVFIGNRRWPVECSNILEIFFCFVFVNATLKAGEGGGGIALPEHTQKLLQTLQDTT